MTGKCRNGQQCRFNHPSSARKNQAHHKEENRELEAEWSTKENVNCKTEFKTGENGGPEGQWMGNHDVTSQSVRDKSDYHFKQNLEHKFSNQPDCVHYLRAGKCSYGDRCKFRHDKKQVYSMKEDLKGEDNKGEQGNEDLKNGWETDGDMCWNQANEASKNGWESDGDGCWDQGNEVLKDGWESSEKVFWDNQHKGRVRDGWVETSEYKTANDVKWMPNEGMTGQQGRRKDSLLYPQRPNMDDCAYYMKTGTCAYGQNCRFNHPYKESGDQHDQHRSFNNGPRTRALTHDRFNDPYAERESQHDRPIRFNKGPSAQALPQNDSFKQSFIERENQYDRHLHSYNRPRRPAMPQNDSWEIGQMKWEHGHLGDPSRTFGRNGFGEERGRQRTDEWKVERQKVYWEKEQKGHGNELAREPSYEYPYRPTEPDCSYYLQTGTCAYGANCKFNHPSLRVQIQCNSAPAVRKYGSDSRHGSTDEEPLELNSLGLPLRHGQRECPYYMQNGSCKFSSNCRFHHPDHNDTDKNGHHSVQNSRSQYQETKTSFHQRPEQSNCPHYMKTGTCKFGSGCKFYHPCNQEPEECLLSPIGLPLRPGKPVCTHYSQRGICKFGPACVYDHPMEQLSSHHRG